jgi:hypothetical protein
MSDNATQSSRPLVNLKGLHERVLLEAALMRFNAQLRDFTPLRDRLVAHGEDANAAYRQIESQRDHVIAELKKLTPRPVLPGPGQKSFHPTPPGGVLSAPLAPALFLPPGNSPLFGYSGSVQIGAALEGDNIVPPDAKSDISTVQLDPGIFYFEADCRAGNPVEDRPPKEYFWLHSWTYLIPFPPAVTGRVASPSSLFTYNIPVAINAWATPDTLTVGAAFWCFVAVGETPDFVGQEVWVNTIDSFPVVTQLPSNFPEPTYHISGESNVQRSFVVQGGHTPAVAVALGVVLALDGGVSMVPSVIATGNPIGVVNFRYEPPVIKTT